MWTQNNLLRIFPDLLNELFSYLTRPPFVHISIPSQLFEDVVGTADHLGVHTLFLWSNFFFFLPGRSCCIIFLVLQHLILADHSFTCFISLCYWTPLAKNPLLPLSEISRPHTCSLHVKPCCFPHMHKRSALH